LFLSFKVFEVFKFLTIIIGGYASVNWKSASYSLFNLVLFV